MINYVHIKKQTTKHKNMHNINYINYENYKNHKNHKKYNNSTECNVLYCTFIPGFPCIIVHYTPL